MVQPRPHVLVADPDPAGQSVLRRMLGQLGYESFAVGDGRAALEAALSGRCVAIVMTVALPLLDGLALCRALRGRRDKLRDLPLVGICRECDELNRRRAMAAGMSECLLGSFRAQELGDALSRALGGAQAAGMVGSGIAPSPKVLAMFFKHAPMRIDAMVAAFRARDAGSLEREARGLESSARTVGAEALAARCRVLGQLGERGATHEAAPVLAGIETELERFRRALSD